MRETRLSAIDAFPLKSDFPSRFGISSVQFPPGSPQFIAHKNCPRRRVDKRAKARLKNKHAFDRPYLNRSFRFRFSRVAHELPPAINSFHRLVTPSPQNWQPLLGDVNTYQRSGLILVHGSPPISWSNSSRFCSRVSTTKLLKLLVPSFDFACLWSAWSSRRRRHAIHGSTASISAAKAAPDSGELGFLTRPR